jgi:hypothetical protein
MQRFTSIQNRYAAQVTKFAKVGLSLSAALNFFVVSVAQAITVAPGAATVSSAPRSSAATVAPTGKVLIPGAPTAQPTTTTSVLQAPPTVLGAPVPAPFAFTGCGVPSSPYMGYSGAYPSGPYGGIGAPVYGSGYNVASTYPGAYSPGCVAAPAPISPAAILTVAAAGCALAAGGIMALSGVSAAADQAAQTPYYENSWTRSGAASTGQFIATNSKGCDMFIDKDGKVGPWGGKALALIRNHPDLYLTAPPKASDAPSYCKEFNNFSVEQKERFWVNFFSAVASPESSCQPNSGHGGLFQVNNSYCPTVSGNNSDPMFNTECAVTAFSRELSKRGKMMSTCTGLCNGSPEYTQWGTLRVDDEHSARGADIGGAKRTRCIIRKFPDCKNPPSVTMGDACGAPTAESQARIH